MDRDKADKEDKLTAHDNNHDPMPVILMAQTEMSNPDGARRTMPVLTEDANGDVKEARYSRGRLPDRRGRQL